MPDYPQNTIWYIEARYKGAETSDYAPAQPDSMGSGVVVTFESLDSNREPFRDHTLARPTKYLLTCAHVVRHRDTDRLADEILCFPPEQGYWQTAAQTRPWGEARGTTMQLAMTSTLSPCGGRRAARTWELRESAADDWVLLEIDDRSFQGQPAATAIAICPMTGVKLRVLGYPGGRLAFPETGHPVHPRVIEDFSPLPSGYPSLIHYDGPGALKPGMSGGGVFDQDGALVGIHRFSQDATMRRGAIRITSITEWLRLNWRTGFVPSVAVAAKNAAQSEIQKPPQPLTTSISIQPSMPLPTPAIDLDTYREELAQALCGAFQDEDALAEMLSYRMQVSLDEIVKPAALKTRVFELIKWAASEGREGELFTKALQSKPGNPKLKALAAKIGYGLPPENDKDPNIAPAQAVQSPVPGPWSVTTAPTASSTMNTTGSKGPKKVFICYSRKDKRYLESLQTNLSLLKRQGLVSTCTDRELKPGDEWKGKLDAALEEADIILFLVSADFVASDYCYDIEMKRAMERHENGEARVIPILIRPCDVKSAPFMTVQGLPSDGRPVTSWPNRDQAWADITAGLRRIL